MKRYYIAIAVLVVIGAATVIGNYMLAQPAVADKQRVDDIIELQIAINNHHNDKGSLPASLNQLSLSSKSNVQTRLGDYTYNKISPSSYELCTTFSTGVQLTYTDTSESIPYTHRKGYQCFKTTLASTSNPVQLEFRNN